MSVTPLSDNSYAVGVFADDLSQKAKSGGVDFIAYVVEFADGTIGHGFIGGYTDEFQIAGHLHRLQNLMTDMDE